MPAFALNNSTFTSLIPNSSASFLPLLFTSFQTKSPNFKQLAISTFVVTVAEQFLAFVTVTV